jgi:hypothetical protein
MLGPRRCPCVGARFTVFVVVSEIWNDENSMVTAPTTTPARVHCCLLDRPLSWLSDALICAAMCSIWDGNDFISEGCHSRDRSLSNAFVKQGCELKPAVKLFGKTTVVFVAKSLPTV